ncbi:acyl-CoA-binding protein [Fulvivirga sediminis]|uniref:Acyl-CoA-binding protein n=1 Tax=Fulvivirga sediminis TaxID=2803949 RepID=A0A937K096_9BACT|nr:acyl-CoA-binding protein [Fulvivirga sediminis]MBL3655287.1 acyl-CoA-binding protein [Fulvivirga sediminis]
MNAEFEKAVKESKELTKRPSNEELLKLYALFKQASEGDNTGERPGGFDFKAIAKHDAWNELKGMSSQEAEKNYIEFVQELQTKYA